MNLNVFSWDELSPMKASCLPFDQPPPLWQHFAASRRPMALKNWM